MQKVRLSLLAAMLMATFAASSLGPIPPAHAATQHFCGYVLNAGAGCGSSQSHWDRVRSRYPGAQAHNVSACVYMWNNATGQIRGGPGWIFCAHSWDTNPIGHNYGVTGGSTYVSVNKLDYNQSPHTLVGWTSDNQTDG
jgi:hypothetical protein